MNKAVFLDRDGVINHEQGYVHKLDDFKFIPGLFQSLQELLRRGYLLVIISNQSGISKGLYTKEDVEIIHTYMLSEFEKNKIKISEVYYAPHHPDNEESLCRKPGSLYVEKALARFNIDPSKSYFIGDKERDIEAGEKVGVKGILIEANRPIGEILNLIS